CSQEPCASCPDSQHGGTREWMRNASDTLCCQWPAGGDVPSGWQRASEEECHRRVVPGLWRSAPSPAPASASTSMVEFAPRATVLNASGRTAVTDAAHKVAPNAIDPV